MMYETIGNDATITGNGEKTLLAGRYRTVKQLGQGGMGSVWLVEDTQLDDKPFAVKMLPSILVSNKRAYRQLKDEALVAMRLVHPNIVQIRAFEENNGNPFLVMDYVEGQTLDDYLAERTGPTGASPVAGGLSEAEVLRILRPIADALDYAHGEGVVHRDVKPANVMIRKDGHPYILDFGIAREIQETMTRVTGKLSSGTLLYMSPEQLMGERPRPAQDVYSFAAMVYECLKGEPPFVRGAIEDQIKNKQPEPLPGTTGGPSARGSGTLAASVMAGLAKKPKDRPATCAAVLRGSGAPAASDGTLNGSGKSAASPNPQQPGGSRSRATAQTTGGARSCATEQDTGNARRFAPVMGGPAREPRNSPPVRAVRSRVGVIGTLLSFLAAVFVMVACLAVYRKSPTIYEAKSEFKMDTRRFQDDKGNGVSDGDSSSSGSDIAEEIFNTRQSDWRSEGIFKKIIQQYRANYPNSTVTDKDLGEMLGSSELELVRHSRLITIAVRSKTPELAAALANAYAEAIESFTDEENKKRCDKAVAQIHQQVEKQKRADDDLAKRLLDFRTAHKIDNLEAERAILNQSLQTTTADVLEYEKRVAVANEWVKVLQAAQKNPENFGELPTEVPRSQDIAAVYTKQQTVKMELARLKTTYTSEYQPLVEKEGEFNAISTELAETVKRALATAQSDLTANQNQLKEFKRKSEELNKKIAYIGKEIVQADAGLKKLEQDKKVSSEIYQNLLQKENEQRIVVEQNNEIVRVGRPAQVPTQPVLPNPRIIFGFGAILIVVIIIVVYIACHLVMRFHRRRSCA